MTETTHTTTPPSTLPLVPGRWTLDAAHSTVSFSVRHLGISKVRGVFHDFTAELIVGDDLATSLVTATIESASIDTGNPDRDAHVRSAELLDVASRPTLVFRSTRIEGGGDEWKVTGDLTIGDVTGQVSLDVELGGIETYPIDGSIHAGFSATGAISRKELGVRFGPLDAALGDTVRIELDLQLVEPR
ncbi:MAG: YceI family protein [Acidimicrobiia bacterium]|nr:YceI family protein [Acidimicrobiia bacterium]